MFQPFQPFWFLFAFLDFFFFAVVLFVLLWRRYKYGFFLSVFICNKDRFAPKVGLFKIKLCRLFILFWIGVFVNIYNIKCYVCIRTQKELKLNGSQNRIFFLFKCFMRSRSILKFSTDEWQRCCGRYLTNLFMFFCSSSSRHTISQVISFNWSSLSSLVFLYNLHVGWADQFLLKISTFSFVNTWVYD